jgi:hypothetical protein
MRIVQPGTDYLNWCPTLKMRLILGLILSLGIVAAEQPKIFPPGSLGPDDDWDRFRSDQLSGCLRSFKEASIWQASRRHVPGAVYRFMWLRSFHPAISVRLDIAADGAGILTTKVSNGCCDCAPPPADTKQTPFRVKTTVRKISAPQLRRFLSCVDAVHFWALPSRKGFWPGPDGADWIIEASKDGRYQLIDAWSPPAGDPASTLGRFMLFDLADLHLSDNEVY